MQKKKVAIGPIRQIAPLEFTDDNNYIAHDAPGTHKYEFAYTYIYTTTIVDEIIMEFFSTFFKIALIQLNQKKQSLS